MFSLILSTDGNIVDICVGSIEVFTLDDVVHNSLKARYSIGHSKWDPAKLLQKSSSFKCSVFSLFWLNSDLVIGTGSVKSAKYLITGNFIYHVLYPRKRISIQESEPVYGLGVIKNKSLFVNFGDTKSVWTRHGDWEGSIMPSLSIWEISEWMNLVSGMLSPGFNGYWATVRG